MHPRFRSSHICCLCCTRTVPVYTHCTGTRLLYRYRTCTRCTRTSRYSVLLFRSCSTYRTVGYAPPSTRTVRAKSAIFSAYFSRALYEVIMHKNKRPRPHLIQATVLLHHQGHPDRRGSRTNDWRLMYCTFLRAAEPCLLLGQECRATEGGRGQCWPALSQLAQSSRFVIAERIAWLPTATGHWCICED